LLEAARPSDNRFPIATNATAWRSHGQKSRLTQKKTPFDRTKSLIPSTPSLKINAIGSITTLLHIYSAPVRNAG
jgi:hypothetical protein